MDPDAASDPLRQLRSTLQRPASRRWPPREVRPTREARPSLFDRLAPSPPSADDAPADPPVVDADPEDRGRRPSARSVVAAVGAVLLVAAAVLIAGASRPPAPAPAAAGPELVTSAPTTTTTEPSAPAARLFPADVAVAGREVRRAGQRWLVGDEGDVVVVGDWDCDHEPTPAVLRPATGEVAVFDAWAAAGRDEPARPVATVAGAVALAAEGCGHARAQTASGTSVRIDTRGER